MTALREVFASFFVEFDDKEIRKGNEEVNKLAQRLNITNPRVIEFAEGLRQAGPQLAAVAAGAAVVAGGVALATAAVVRAVEDFAHLNRELDLNARRLGVTTDQMQALGLMAADAGQDVDAVTDAMSTLQERARDAVIDRQSDPAQQLRRLGIEIPRTTAELPDAVTLLGQVSDGLAAMGNQSDRVGASMTLFGDVGRELLPVLQQGSSAIDAYAAELERLGGGASREAIEASAELARAQARLDLATVGLRSNILTNLIPVLEGFVQIVTEAVGWLNRNESVVQSVLIALGIMAGVIAAVLLPVLFAFMVLLAPLWIALGLVVAVVVGLVLVIQDLIVWVRGGNSVIGTFIEGLLSLAGISMERVREEIRSVFDTLRNGYNSIAETIGLPTISAGGASPATPPAEGGQGSGGGLLGLGGADFLRRFQAGNQINQSRIRAGELAAGRPTGGGVVNQQNAITIQGNDPIAIAREVERVMDRQNRDAVEAVGA